MRELKKGEWSKEGKDRGCREEKIWQEKRKGRGQIERNKEGTEERWMK